MAPAEREGIGGLWRYGIAFAEALAGIRAPEVPAAKGKLKGPEVAGLQAPYRDARE